MSIVRCDQVPADVRGRLYNGELFIASATEFTRQLTGDIVELLTGLYGSSFLAPSRAARDDFLWRIAWLRKYIRAEERFDGYARTLARSLGFGSRPAKFEPFRLRAVLHAGHETPRAASAYVVHRDTWYAHPQACITAWLPVFDLSEDETFSLFPDWFNRPIRPNDSGTFVYAPGAATELDRRVAEDYEAEGRVVEPQVEFGDSPRFSIRRGEILLFSGAHLHRTRPHYSGRTRFSLDCRFVDLDDHTARRGAPNVDNESKGCALTDYRFV